MSNRIATTASAELNPLDLISIENDQPVTTSLKVAEVFGKRHRDVLRKIDGLDCSDKYRMRNFAHTVRERKNPSGGAPIASPLCKMTKNGFVFLIMGFTGKKAAKFKEDYIAAFDLMAEQLLLKQQSPTTPSEPPINTTGPHWMQIDDQPVITFRGIIAIHGYRIGQLNYLYHKHESRFARHSWLLAASNERFQQLKDQGQQGCIVRLFDAEGYRLLLQLFRDEYQPRLEAEQAELLPAPEAASEQQQPRNIIPFYGDLNSADLPYPTVRHEQSSDEMDIYAWGEIFMDVFDEARRGQARCDGLGYKTICHYLLKSWANRDPNLQQAAEATLYAMRKPLGLEKVTDRK
ncbi:MAG: Rha family transcriptional regulator [Marinobacterium sp.]|nr:Rha family transcriptional regulator [Marinobacterium sp.]